MTTAEARRLRRIRGLALVIGALSLVVVAVSAYLRLDAAGLGCSDWPACYGVVLSGHPSPLHYGAARLLHRVAASAALVFACILVWQCWRPQPVAAARPALLLLALMLALSALGFFSADPRRVLVGALNIIGGLGLVSFSWRVVLATRSPAGVAPLWRQRAFRAGIVALTLTVVVGAWLGASYSAVACLSLPGCTGGAVSLADGWAILDPFLVQYAPPAPGSVGGVLLHLLHRSLALVALVLLGAGLMRGGRSLNGNVRIAATATLLLLPVVAALGIAGVASGLSLWLIIGHGVGAALLLAAVASLQRR